MAAPSNAINIDHTRSLAPPGRATIALQLHLALLARNHFELATEFREDATVNLGRHEYRNRTGSNGLSRSIPFPILLV